MTQNNSNPGFSIVEGLLILVVVGILGFTGWYVYHVKQMSDKNYSANNSTVPSYKKRTSTSATSVNPYAGWQQYCSDYGGICFKYPQNWTSTSTQTSDQNVKGLTLVPLG